MNTKTEKLIKLPKNYMRSSDEVCILYFIGLDADYDNYSNYRTIYRSIKNGKTTIDLSKDINDIDKCVSKQRAFNTYSQEMLSVFDIIWFPSTTKKKVDDTFREGIYCEVARQMFPNKQNRYTAKQAKKENNEDIEGGTEMIFYCNKEAIDISKEILYNALYGSELSDRASSLINDTIKQSLSSIIEIFSDEDEVSELSFGISNAEKKIKKDIKFHNRDFYRKEWIIHSQNSSPGNKVLYITSSSAEAIELLNVHREKNYDICITSYIKYNNVLKRLGNKKKVMDSSLFNTADEDICSLDESCCSFSYMTEESIKNIRNYNYVLFHIPSNGKSTKFFLKIMNNNILHKCKLFVSDRVTMHIETHGSTDYSQEREYFNGNIVSVIHENFNPELDNSAGKAFLLIDIDRDNDYPIIDYHMFGIHLGVKKFADCRLYGSRNIVESILNKVHSKFSLCKEYAITKESDLKKLGLVYMIIYNDNVQMPLGHENELPTRWFYKDSYYDRGFFNGIMNSNDKWVDRILCSETFDMKELIFDRRKMLNPDEFFKNINIKSLESKESKKGMKFHNPTFIYAKTKEELENLSYNLHYTNLGRYLAMVSTWDNQSNIRALYPYMVDKKYHDTENWEENEMYDKLDLSIKEIREIENWNRLMYGKCAFYLRYKTGDKSIDVRNPYEEIIENRYMMNSLF